MEFRPENQLRYILYTVLTPLSRPWYGCGGMQDTCWWGWCAWGWECSVVWRYHIRVFFSRNLFPFWNGLQTKWESQMLQAKVRRFYEKKRLFDLWRWLLAHYDTLWQSPFLPTSTMELINGIGSRYFLVSHFNTSINIKLHTPIPVASGYEIRQATPVPSEHVPFGFVVPAILEISTSIEHLKFVCLKNEGPLKYLKNPSKGFDSK